MKKKMSMFKKIRRMAADRLLPEKKADGSAVDRLGFAPEEGSRMIRTMQEMKPTVYEYFMESEDRTRNLKLQLAHGMLQAIADKMEISVIRDLDRDLDIVIGEIKIVTEGGSAE